MAKTKKANYLPGMTRVQFGKRYGVFANQVARWIEQGVVVLDADAKVNVAASDRVLAHHRPRYGKKHDPPQPVMEKVNEQTKLGFPPLPEPDPELDPTPLGGDARRADFHPESRQQAAQSKDAADALLKMLRYRKEAEATVFGFFRQERDAGLSWPDRVGTELAAILETDPRRTTIALRELVGQHLDDLAKSEPPPLEQEL